MHFVYHVVELEVYFFTEAKPSGCDVMVDEEKSKKNFPPQRFVIFVVVIFSGLYFWNHYEIRFDKESGLVFARRSKSQQQSHALAASTVEQENEFPETQPFLSKQVAPMTTMTIATWDLTPLNFEKLADATRAQRISDIISQFDLIAVQGIVRTTQPLDEIIRRINAKGKKYAYVAPKNLGSLPEYVAFLFDTETVKHDSERVYDIVEPSLSYRPLVTSFCSVQPPPEKAFTFNLVNINIPNDRKDIEAKVLGMVFRSVRDRSAENGEDDVIMLGNFGLPVQQIDSLCRVPYLAAVHHDLPTTIDELDSTCNIVFDNQRTIECNGNAKRVDLIKLYDLKLKDAADIARHFPICAEFSVFEGSP